MTEYADLTKLIGYSFQDKTFFYKFLYHPGFDRRNRHFERLEFLGDRVLGLVISEWLLELFPDESECMVARRYVSLTDHGCASRIGTLWQLDKYGNFDPGNMDNEEHRKTVISDACEALLGAVFLDGGWSAVRKIIRQHWHDEVHGYVEPPVHPKTQAQEIIQKRYGCLPQYHVTANQAALL